MSRYLVTTLLSNDLGLVSRALPIAEELSFKAHEVYFVSNNLAPTKIINSAGFTTIQLQNIFNEFPVSEISFKSIVTYFNSSEFKERHGNVFSFLFKLLKTIPIKFNSSTSHVVDMDHFFSLTGMLNRNFILENIEAFIRLIKQYKIDFVIDFWNPYSCIAAKVAGIPLITINQADVLPGGKGFIWWRNNFKHRKSVVPTINNVLRHYNLNEVATIQELLIGNLTLVMGMEETDPLDHNNYNYIGSILWQEDEREKPEWLNKIDKSKPLVWVYSGNPRYGNRKTDFDSDIVIKSCINLLKNEDVNIILTTGHHKIPKKYLPLPQNFYFSNYLPGISIARECDLMIHHGGYGSCQTALYTGTPSLIIPTFSERESNARRIAIMGAGEVTYLTKGNRKEKHIDEKQMKKLFRQILSNPGYKERAIFFGEKLKMVGGIERAMQLINDFTNNYNTDLFNDSNSIQLNNIGIKGKAKKVQMINETI